MDAFLKDLKHSVRMLVRTPSFTIAALFALTLGIAANTVVFSVLNAVLLKPLPYSDPQRIVMFQNAFKPFGQGGTASPTEFNFWRQQTTAFQDVSAYSLFDVANLTGGAFPEQIRVMRISAGFFRLCGADAMSGRTFTAEDDRPNAPKTLMLAHAFWQQRFGGDPQVIGSRVTLDDERYEIIGVADSSLESGHVSEMMLGNGDITIEEPPAVYIPFQLGQNSTDHSHFFNVAGRLKPGVTVAVANARLQASFPEYGRQWPGDMRGRTGFRVQPLQDALVGGVRSSLLILLTAVGLVLLIACANVANLLLARATGRTREIAIRAAVGAGRGRIVRQLLTESVTLSLIGGCLGVAAGYAGIRAILTLSPGNIPRIGTGGANVSLDWQVLSFTLALSILTGILFGLVPALQSSRWDLSSPLREGGMRSGPGFRQSKSRALLVTTEITLALVLLIGAGLLIRSFVAIRQVDLGFDANSVLTLRTSFAGPRFEEPANVTQVVQDGIRRIGALPGVEVAATTSSLPLEPPEYLAFQIVGRPEGPTSQVVAAFTLVSPRYFETLKIPVLRGRSFTEQDGSGPPVVLLNETLAKRFWPTSDPVDDHIIIGDSLRRIIGIVGDVRVQSPRRDPLPNVYLPSTTGSDQRWVIRTSVDPTSLSAAIQDELHQSSGGLPVARVRTMREIVSRSRAADDFNALVLTIFAGAALFLAVIGIYGLMTCSVIEHTQEIGIRLALGAASSDIRNSMVLQGLRLALVGIACGLIAAFALTRLMANLLFGVEAWDPPVFLAVPLLLVSVTLAAVWLPARRAGRVEPAVALRRS